MRTIYIIVVTIFLVFCMTFNGPAAESPDLNAPRKIKLPSKSVSVAQSLSAFEKAASTQPDILQALNQYRNSLSIVFVPGILGSKLEDSQGVIWGKQDINHLLAHRKEFWNRLSLDPRLIDEKAVSGVEATIFDEMAGVHLYGKAVMAMNSRADKLGIKFATCGYDWRRDIRAGADYLDKCINKIDSKERRNLIIIAHSMGGLVAWVWAMEHSQQHNIRQVVILGSPLEGSCEIIRMIQEGYVQPTAANKILIANNRDTRNDEEEWLVTLMGRLRNSLASGLSQEIRPLILTWPGAIELSPKPTDVKALFNCANPVADPSDPLDSHIISYYEPEFWTMQIGRELLKPYPLPTAYERVLAKASEFRKWFSPERLNAPTWLYYSEAWMVPNEVPTILRDNVVYLGSPWTTSQGDGRVPRDSAMMRIGSSKDFFSYGFGVTSVHGNLPADPDFLKDYFETRLPKVRNAIIALSVAKDSLDKPAWIKGYIRSGGGIIDDSELRAIFDPNSAVPPSLATMEAIDTLRAFDQEVCKYTADGCATSYKEAKDFVKIAPKQRETNASITQMGSAARGLGNSHHDYALAEGNKGMQLARAGEWSSAAVSLSNAEEQLNNLPKAATHENQAKNRKFKIAVKANLAKALYLAGYCKRAAPLLRETTGYWSFSQDALKMPCKDVSGLLYCFDTNDYCRKK
ncbi:MAG: esterase/lipase family protein [Syntrophales bacterium]